MKDSSRLKVLALYTEYHTLYGPYLRKDGRKVVILYDGVKRSARQLAKVKLEVKLGRRLVSGEEVDHVDEDFTNDRMSNLQLLTKGENLLKGHRNGSLSSPKPLYGQKNPMSKVSDTLMSRMCKARRRGNKVSYILDTFKPDLTYDGLCKALNRNM